MNNNQISFPEESYGHLRGVTSSHLGGVPKGRVLKAQSQTGQSLLEVIVAMTAGILVVAALTYAVIFSLRNANFAKTSSQATKLAQEGIERVKTGRDRNQCINSIPIIMVNSWNGGNGSCSTGDPIWSYQINGSSGCTNDPNPNCYFNVTNTGSLNYLTNGSSVPAQFAETVAPNFKRVVILSDDAGTYTTQKKVTIIVQWTDFAGPHQSMLTTILRKL